MADREKVVKAFVLCRINEGCTTNCPYWNDKGCAKKLATDVYSLLKEQEAVKPHYNARTNWYECGVCHYSMTSGMHCRSELIPAYKVGFCAKCGRKQEWE